MASSTSGPFVGAQIYYPIGVEIPNYVANETALPELLTVFFAAWVVAMGAGIFIATAIRRQTTKGAAGLTASEYVPLAWFMLCGFIHLCFEGYYVLHVNDVASKQTYAAQLWKEYSQADSRYLTRDAFMVTMEGLTSFVWGPLCFLTVYLIATKSAFRHVVQLIISTGQLYGTLLYFGTAHFDGLFYGLTFTRPELLYTGFYYFFMNIIWCIVPSAMIWDSVKSTHAAFVVAQSVSDRKSGSGVKKD